MDPTNRTDRQTWLRRGCALLVALVAAYASYEHQRRFALQWGSEPVTAALWPLSVDGLVVLTSMTLLGHPGTHTTSRRWPVRAAFLLAVAVSLIANIAAAPTPTWQAITVVGWPPIALLLAVELLGIRPVPVQAASGHSPIKTPEQQDAPRPMSTRTAVQQLVESSATPLTHAEIVKALHGPLEKPPDKRFKANISNALWELRKSGIIKDVDGRNSAVPKPATAA